VGNALAYETPLDEAASNRVHDYSSQGSAGCGHPVDTKAERLCEKVWVGLAYHRDFFLFDHGESYLDLRGGSLRGAVGGFEPAGEDGGYSCGGWGTVKGSGCEGA